MRTRDALVRLSRTTAARVAAIIVAALAGAWLGLAAGGRVNTVVGPVDVEMSLRPSWGGGTVIDIPPLGTLWLDTHEGPVQLRVSLDQIRLADAQRLIDQRQSVAAIAETITAQVWHGIWTLLVKSAVLATLGAALVGAILFRDLARTAWTSAAAVGLAVVVAGAGWLTYNPRALAEPHYTGLLVGAPRVVGDAADIVERFAVYREQLAKLVTNVSRLYEVGSTLPVYQPAPSTIKVLHVSDIHLNPEAYDVIRSVAEQFQVQLIIDSGDLTDHGSAPEDRFIDAIRSLKVPYVFVRGNHDSRHTQRAVARRGGIVLDDRVADVAGLRLYGVGDPRFTPDKTTRDNAEARQLAAIGSAYAAKVAATTPPVDIAIIHDPDEGQAFSGAVPLVLSGHVHYRSTTLLRSGTRLFVQGSTGGAGLRGLEHEKPTPIELSVLYFNQSTHRLQAWDDITVGGLGLSSVQIERHLEPNPNRAVSPTPTPSPSGATTSAGPATSPSPSVSPTMATGTR